MERDPLDVRTPRSHNFQSKESVPQYVRFTASLKTGHVHSAETFADIHRIPRWLTAQFSGKSQVTYMYRTCITTVRLGHVPPPPPPTPIQGLSQQKATRLVAPLAAGTPASSSQLQGLATHTHAHAHVFTVLTSTFSHYFQVQLLLTLSSHTCILPHPITHTYTARLPSENSRTVFERLPPFDGIRA